jgi:hypothetical protein
MKLKDMKMFFEHVGNRERSLGITEAFRFKKVLSSRKKGSIRDARYIAVHSESDHTPAQPSTNNETDTAPAPRDNDTNMAPSQISRTSSISRNQNGDKDTDTDTDTDPASTPALSYTSREKEGGNDIDDQVLSPQSRKKKQQERVDEESNTAPAPFQTQTKRNIRDQEGGGDEELDTAPAPIPTQAPAESHSPAPAQVADRSQNRGKKKQVATEGTRKSSRHQKLNVTNTDLGPVEHEGEMKRRSSRSKGKRRI